MYADAKNTKYGYTAGGRLETRLWARGTNTTYSYDNAGELSGVDYGDTTPDVTLTYDRAGRLQAVATNGVTAVQRTHTWTGLLASETQGEVIVNYGYNSLRQLETLNVTRAGTNLLSVSYQYDEASRLRG
ncbi:hypothetical protein NXS98_07550 [Fontisphaera persica]|uniref:hypothetical protein n=1 Tax=Fontisphaera persica TaxID=2974023 RepID=UPI0024BFA6B5|nr:hypothetical protein [Fontisphaera persica]WCJ60965.1 hypothetical protein NXS98_07550 [Fontisphaera persica]